MTSIGDKIRARRLELNMTQEELADRLGYKSKSTINKIELGINDIVQSKVVEFAKALDTTTSYLMSWDSSTPSYEAAAGEGRIGDGYPTGEANLRVDEDQVVVTVRGRSMEPTLMDGDLVVVEATSVADSPTRIYLVKVNGEEHTLKHVVMNEDGLTLTADNMSVFPPRLYTAQQVKDLPVTIEGVVVRLVREME